MALLFRFERSVRITPNSRQRREAALHRHHRWLKLPERQSSNCEATRVEPARARHPTGEIALIVGVGPGLGIALARRLASEGMFVVMASRNAHRLDALSDEIVAAGGLACAYGCDATSESSVAELFHHVGKNHGVPHVVIYSLQDFGPGRAIDIEVPAFEQAWRHNCLGAFLVAREAARQMLPQKRGSILLVGSTSSVLGREGHLNLAVGKFGQRALSQVLARELWPHGIHVCHLIIDADVAEDGIDGVGSSQSDPNDIADVVLSVHRQPRTAWTSELDARPWNERFWEHC